MESKASELRSRQNSRNHGGGQCFRSSPWTARDRPGPTLLTFWRPALKDTQPWGSARASAEHRACFSHLPHIGRVPFVHLLTSPLPYLIAGFPCPDPKGREGQALISLSPSVCYPSSTFLQTHAPVNIQTWPHMTRNVCVLARVCRGTCACAYMSMCTYEHVHTWVHADSHTCPETVCLNVCTRLHVHAQMHAVTPDTCSCLHMCTQS